MVIGVLKLGKALMLTLIGFGMLTILKGDHADRLEHWLTQFRPGMVTHYADEGLDKLVSLPKRWQHLLDIGAFLYAALFAVEGFGLIAGRRWAEWVTVVTTAGLIPFEAFEIYRRPTALLRIVILLVNAAILAYLIWQIRTHDRTGDSTSDLADRPATGPKLAEPVPDGGAR